jgi:hypothetical protein
VTPVQIRRFDTKSENDLIFEMSSPCETFFGLEIETTAPERVLAAISSGHGGSFSDARTGQKPGAKSRENGKSQ